MKVTSKKEHFAQVLLPNPYNPVTGIAIQVFQEYLSPLHISPHTSSPTLQTLSEEPGVRNSLERTCRCSKRQTGSMQRDLGSNIPKPVSGRHEEIFYSDIHQIVAEGLWEDDAEFFQR